MTAPVNSYAEIEAKEQEGTRNRTVAATNMNATSSRAHTIVAINFTQKALNDAGQSMTKQASINLVDLAGRSDLSLLICLRIRVMTKSCRWSCKLWTSIIHIKKTFSTMTRQDLVFAISVRLVCPATCIYIMANTWQSIHSGLFKGYVMWELDVFACTLAQIYMHVHVGVILI